jgi:hypothetical protein
VQITVTCKLVPCRSGRGDQRVARLVWRGGHLDFSGHGGRRGRLDLMLKSSTHGTALRYSSRAVSERKRQIQMQGSI